MSVSGGADAAEATTHRRKVRAVSLFWRIFLPNAAVLVAVTLALAISPAAIPTPWSLGGAAVVIGALGAMLAINLFLMRRALTPLGRLSALMRRVDLLHPGQRIPVYGADAEVVELTEAFNDMLGRLEEERRSSAGHAVAAQEGERRRVSQELHDEVGQSLTAVVLELGQVAKEAPEDARARLLEVQESARSSLEDVRRIARQLRPEALDDLGLVSALTSLSERLADAADLRVVRRLTRDLPPLSPEQELAVYRIAQESLTNVARHASASVVEVILERTEAGLRLRVTDDGRGFDEDARRGAGLRGMSERALLAGGRLTVEARSGRGVQVTLDLPATSDPAVRSPHAASELGDGRPAPPGPIGPPAGSDGR